MTRLRHLLPLLLVTLAACGGRGEGDAIPVDVPEPERRVAIRTLEPGPSPTPTPVPTPEPTPGPTPSPVPAPQGATLTSAGGVQRGITGSFCWSEVVGGPLTCFEPELDDHTAALMVQEGEEIVLQLEAEIPPNDESIRPFRGTRSGFPVQQIEPALITDLVVELPEGTWSLDVCAAWHGRGQPICWLFRLEVLEA